MEHIHWYPGHMAKTKKAILNDIKLVDIVIELLDARIPYSSKNYDIDNWTQGKLKILVLNKVDLADPKSTKIWETHFKEQGKHVIQINAKQGQGIKEVTAAADELMKDKLQRLKERGRIFKPTRAMIVGIPNVGKSTFINSYVKKSIAKVANKPGVTRTNQWIKINKGFELLDTPGMLPPRMDDQESALHLALAGSIGYKIDVDYLAIKFIEILKNKYPHILIDRYKVTELEDKSLEDIFYQIATNRSILMKGSKIDSTRCANMLLDEFKSNKLEKITLELPKTADELAELARKSAEIDKRLKEK